MKTRHSIRCPPSRSVTRSAVIEKDLRSLDVARPTRIRDFLRSVRSVKRPPLIRQGLKRLQLRTLVSSGAVPVSEEEEKAEGAPSGPAKRRRERKSTRKAL